MGNNHSGRHGFLLPLVLLLSFAGKGNAQDLLKKNIIAAIESHYYKEINLEELERSSVSKILESLDADSSLVEPRGKESDFVRGFKLKKTVQEFKWVTPDIGYLKLSSFDKSSPMEFKKVMDELFQNGAKKFILDLRENSGGDFEAAVQIADLFVPRGKTLAIVKKRNEETIYYSKTPERFDRSFVVLVNGGTASSAEFLALILKKYCGSKVVGHISNGKRTLQNIIPIESYWLTLTVGTWGLPGETISSIPYVQPDYEILEFDEQMAKAVQLLNEKILDSGFSR